jgi:hypothetical protein
MTWQTRRTGVVPTAPPTTRYSAKSVLHEETRPTAPEPEPGVRFDRHEGRHLVDVHNHYRREVKRVRDLVARVREGSTGIGDARAELNRMTLRGICRNQCAALTQHHTLESSLLFPFLRDSQPDLADVLDRLDDEHQAIHDLLEAVDAALVHLVREPDDFEPVTEAVDLLTDTLLSHFAYEERELVAPLSRHGFF